MPDDDDPEPDHVWDEYAWERFLQQQDRKTEKYMELLERYLDDPNRDQIIAREMGWHHLTGEAAMEWEEATDAQFYCEALDDAFSAEPADALLSPRERAQVHPLYHSAFALTGWLDAVLETSGASAHPRAVDLVREAAIAGAKLAAALSDDDIDEIGMTIAYLKRAARAINLALDASLRLREDGAFTPATADKVQARLFEIRDGTISLMGDFRAEWRRRHGSG